MTAAPDHADLGLTVPPFACDCHMHVFGAPGDYPIPALRSYTPQAAPLASWRTVAATLGLMRVVVVQPSVYGLDNRCTLDALRSIGAQGRGIVQIDPATLDPDLQDLHAAGVRGVRLNPKSVGLRDLDGLRELIGRTARRIAPFGWHLQIYTALPMLAELAEAIRDAPVPVVLDHMGGARAGDDAAALRPLLDLLGSGRCWVKLSGAYRVSRLESGFEDATAIARLLVQTNAEQLVWGTDWPHTAHHAGTPRLDAPLLAFRALDAIHLMRCLADAARDQSTFTRILETNAARLYGF